MLRALRWQPIEETAAFDKLFEEWAPYTTALPTALKTLSIANDDESIARPREEDVEALGTFHETDITSIISSRETNDDDVAFFALKVVYRDVSECCK